MKHDYKKAREAISGYKTVLIADGVNVTPAPDDVMGALFSALDSALTREKPAVTPDVGMVDDVREAAKVIEAIDADFCEQVHRERVKEDFDAPDDREYCVNITARQLRYLSKAAATLNRALLTAAAEKGGG
jgi:hypothetical protein